jgi:hypothetical protein
MSADDPVDNSKEFDPLCNRFEAEWNAGGQPQIDS